MSDWKLAYEEHGPAVLAFLASRLPRRDEAEDLLQETFVRAMRADRLRDAGKLRPYLFTIAHTLMANRGRRRPLLLFSQTAPEARRALEERPTGEAASPEAGARMSSLEQRLEELLDELTPGLRSAFRMAVLEQRPYREIAEANGWTEGQVKVNVHRARKRAMTALADYLPAPEAST